MQNDDLIGKKFGRLIVMQRIEKTKYLCKCECGNIKEIYKNNFISGRTKSCGCLSKEIHKNKYSNLTDKKFGLLRVIEYAGIHNGRSSWLCECECGTKCIVTGHDLKNGHTKSCGCLRRKNKAVRDLKGQVFRYLQAIESTELRSKTGSVYWRCKCLRCGRYTVITENVLVHGNQQSCGCLKNKNVGNMRKGLHFYEGTCLEYLNRKKRNDNTSGVTGVYKIRDNIYVSKITFQGKVFNLGRYQSFLKAVSARKKAEEELYGKFIKSYTKWLDNSRSNKNGMLKEFKFRVKRIDKKFVIELD